MSKYTALAIKKALQIEFESCSGLTPQFAAFAKLFKAAMKAELEKVGATLVAFNRGHFTCSGFYQVGDKFGYFSIGDVRSSHSPGELMYRSAKSTKDYSGGSNNWGDFDNPNLFERMVKLIA